VNQSAESIPSEHAAGVGRADGAGAGAWLRRDETKRPMRAVSVVVLNMDPQRALELAAAEDQDPVEALAPHGADEALGKRIRLRP
jgi:hypothetical protein